MSFFADGEIVVLPVNHVMDGNDPVFRTARGSKLSAAEGQDVVAFEADAYDERTRSGWSVLVNGRAYAIYEEPGDPAPEPPGPAARGWPPRNTRSGSGSGPPRSPGGGRLNPTTVCVRDLQLCWAALMSMATTYRCWPAAVTTSTSYART